MLKKIFFDKKREKNEINFTGATPPKTLCELLTKYHWDEVFSDCTPVSVSDPILTWLNPPEEDFLTYVLKRTPLSFDGVPPDDTIYIKEPTFMMAQVHRLWITTGIIQRILENRKDFSILDVGAFPFSVDIILRDYLGFSGNIFVTTNWAMEESWVQELSERDIKIKRANLDPFVIPCIDGSDMKNYLEIEDNSMDVVLCTHVVEHLYHPFSLFKEINRVLKPNGKFLITTDNAFMLSTFFNLSTLGDYIHEPVEGTAAMSFHQWRGHNRFFSGKDLQTLLEKSGFTVSQIQYFEVLYNSFINDYFLHPVHSLPRWRANILTLLPDYRNEVVVLGEKVKTG